MLGAGDAGPAGDVVRPVWVKFCVWIVTIAWLKVLFGWTGPFSLVVNLIGTAVLLVSAALVSATPRRLRSGKTWLGFAGLIAGIELTRVLLQQYG